MIVYTGGTFDLFHEGHVELLRVCRELAGPDGRVVVALNTDAFIERYKGRLPAQPYGLRASVLRSSGLVDLVVCNVGGEFSGTSIDVIVPDVLAIGDDWLDADSPTPEARYWHQLGVTGEWLETRRLHVVYVPRTTGQSTTRLRSGS